MKEPSEILLRILVALFLGLIVAFVYFTPTTKIYGELLLAVISVASFILTIWGLSDKK
jgi:hypothetical protein